MIKRIISLTVLNQPGVLNRITNLFSKRNYNIESISVGPSELEGVSRITCAVLVDNENIIEQITKQLNKQIDVIKVVDITDQSIVSRELALSQDFPLRSPMIQFTPLSLIFCE